MFFDKTSTGATALIAEVELHLKETYKDGFTLADVLNLFNKEINKPKSERKGTPWEDFYLATIQAVVQRFRSLPATLKGLIDVTGKGLGLSKLTELKPYDHVIVFADELNRLAPRDGNGGIGEYLSQLARTTRDRGIVLFGAGQFRSGINEDILKAASVHYSMRTPEHELSDRIYAPLSPEFKARLTQLEPGQTVLQYPSLRTAVFAHFPRPFVMSGALAWQKHFPPVEDRPLAECIYERLARLDPLHSPLISEVKRSLDSLMERQEEREKQRVQKDLINVLRNIEVLFVSSGTQREATPWQTFLQDIAAHYPARATTVDIAMTPTPPNFEEGRNEGWE